MSPTDSINELPFPIAADAALAGKPSEIEREVMELFEQFRTPLLRYAISLGLPVHDAEEVIQEVFLALFRHLQLGRSRRSLRGWIFSVAHNLALKQRYANERLCDNVVSNWAIAEEPFDPSPNPEEHLSSAQRRRELAGRCSSSSGSGSGLPPAACGGSPLPGNRIGTRNVPGSCIDIADSITGTVDSCGREISYAERRPAPVGSRAASGGGRGTPGPSRSSS